MKKLQVRDVYNKMGWFFCVLEGIMLFVQVLFIILGYLLKIDIEKNMNFLYIVSAVSYYGVAFPLFALCMSTLDGNVCNEKKPLGVLGFFKLFFISFALMNLTNFINVGFYGVFKLFTGHEMASNLDGVLTEVSVLMVLTTVVLAPVFEELTFRYLALNKLRKYGDKTAILVTSVLFGLFHMNFEQAIYAFAIGLVFGYVVCKTGRVIYTILLHAMVNLCGGVVPLLVEKIDNPMVELIYTVLFFSFLIIGIVLFILNVKKIKFNQAFEPVSHPVISFFTSPGMLVFVITSILVAFVTLIGQVITALFG